MHLKIRLKEINTGNCSLGQKKSENIMAAQQRELMRASGGSSFRSDEDVPSCNGIADKFTEISLEIQTPVLA